jgi:uncharacterized protein YkwD
MKPSVIARVILPAFAFTIALLGINGPVNAVDAPAQPATVTARAAATPLMSTDTYETRVRRFINKQRLAHGLRALRQEACTDRLAENWGSFLANNSEFFHQSMGRILDTCGATYAGETLAMGQVRPRQMVTMWMNSPGHRAIILSKSPRRIGIGAYPDANGTWVVAADFTRF